MKIILISAALTVLNLTSYCNGTFAVSETESYEELSNNFDDFWEHFISGPRPDFPLDFDVSTFNTGSTKKLPELSLAIDTEPLQPSPAAVMEAESYITNEQVQNVESIEPIVVKYRPVRILGYLVNEVSRLMGLDTIHVTNFALPILNRTIDRYEELVVTILEKTRNNNSEEAAFMDAESAEKALERVHNFRQSEGLRGKKSDAPTVFEVVCGLNGSKYRSSVEHFKETAIVFAKTAIMVYGGIPGVILNDAYGIIVDGKCFPPAVTKKRKRPLNDDDERPKKIPRQLSTLSNTRYRGNAVILKRLHNSIADFFGKEQLPSSSRPGECIDQIASMLVELVDVALSIGSLIRHEIHEQYPVSIGFLEKSGKRLSKLNRLSKNQCQTILAALGKSNDKNLPAVDAMYFLGQWYAAIALAVIPSLPYVDFLSEQLLIDGEPLLRHIVVEEESADKTDSD